MRKLLFLVVAMEALISLSCKKSNGVTSDVKTKFIGNWAGVLQYTGASTQYKYSLAINADNSVVNIDSAFGNQRFPGTYVYTADSLKITYNNGTKWSLKFADNYSGCSGGVLGYTGAVGSTTMTKK